MKFHLPITPAYIYFEVIQAFLIELELNLNTAVGRKEAQEDENELGKMKGKGRRC